MNSNITSEQITFASGFLIENITTIDNDNRYNEYRKGYIDGVKSLRDLLTEYPTHDDNQQGVISKDLLDSIMSDIFDNTDCDCDVCANEKNEFESQGFC